MLEIISNITTEFILLRELYLIAEPTLDEYEDLTDSIDDMIDGKNQTKYNLKLKKYENIDKTFSYHHYVNILISCLAKYYNLELYKNEKKNVPYFLEQLVNKMNVDYPHAKLLVDKSIKK